MSRLVWMDRTIEAARTAKVVMPWSRSTRHAEADAPEQAPQPAVAQR
jgi:hypothetical protein